MWYKWERDVIVAHGASRFLGEKYFDHSDGYKQFRCRCGKEAIVNIDKGIYQCNFCKENASIVKNYTSWSSRLFIQELNTMSIGTRLVPEPFTYNVSDDNICESIENFRGK